MHPLAFMDVISDDIEISLAYYAEMFDWSYERLPIDHGEDYRLVRSEGVVVAGAEQVAVERQLEPTWTVMVEVDDARPVIDTAVAAGATETFVLAPMLDLGRIAMLRDPWGATLGVWEPGEFRPSSTPRVPGGLDGAILTSPDPDGSRRYHRTVFGWQDAPAGDLDAGLPVRIEQADGPARWTPVLRGPVRAGGRPLAGVDRRRPDDSKGLSLLHDSSGAPFYLRTHGAAS